MRHQPSEKKPPALVRESLLRRFELSASGLSLLAATFIIIVNNSKLCHSLAECIDLNSMSGALYLITVYASLSGVMAIAFMLFGQGFLMKPLIIGVVLISSILSYFTDELGVIFDPGMIQNVQETARDRNTAEAVELLSSSLFVHFALLGVLPSLLIAVIRIKRASFRRELLRRALYSGAILTALAISILANFKDISYITRNNRSLRMYATPAYAADSLRKYVVSTSFAQERPFVVRGADATHVKQTRQRTIGIMVVGETSRADHWSLNGYSRQTNPLLQKRELLNFSNMCASGTSTAYSVPCMFSLLDNDDFSTEKAKQESNVLDVIQRSGVEVVWLENNSSSKGVTNRLGSYSLCKHPDPDSPLSTSQGFYDEIFIEYLDRYIDKTESDMLIVLHTMGSHGPAYFLRYPSEFEVFNPSCKSNAPQECDDQSLINAYDNTILYTDFILDELIEALDSREDSIESFVLYSSDHGESLGENGVYLHGLPTFLAPEAQTHIPAFLWVSSNYIGNHNLDMEWLRARTDLSYSHDYISHTLLSMLDVQTSEFVSELDLLKDARK